MIQYKNKIRCRKCLAIFDEPDIMCMDDEYLGVCPRCRCDDLEDVEICDVCGKAYPVYDNVVHNGVCENCMNEKFNLEIGMKCVDEAEDGDKSFYVESMFNCVVDYASYELIQICKKSFMDVMIPLFSHTLTYKENLELLKSWCIDNEPELLADIIREECDKGGELHEAD